MDMYETGLEPGAANHVPLTPLSFLGRSARAFPHKTAVIHGERRISYGLLQERCVRLASALRGAGVGAQETVAVMAPNTPALLEAHYGVAMAGAVLNAINTRLDAATVAFILRHGGAKVLIADRDYCEVVRAALADLDDPPRVIDVVDPLGRDGHGASMAIGREDYEAFLASGDPGFAWEPPVDEWQAIALNYTSGTTGDPKGAVYHHRGAYLNALGNALAFGLPHEAVYLWTLPMFHCSGWTYTWAVTAVGGTHICLRNVEAGRIFGLIREHRVTHMCAAPIVLNMLGHAAERPQDPFDPRVRVATGGAAPPSSLIARMEAMGFDITHLYGLTETYGPNLLCQWQREWNDLPLELRARKMARQGIQTITAEAVTVRDRERDTEVPADGETLGEIAVRGNTVMKGYLKNPEATANALRDGWFRTGDLAVRHEDGYIEVKDRLKDIIISGGENISTLEVEEVLYGHPDVMEAAVVAKPDEKWGETPCAFVTPRPDVEIDADELIRWCRERLAGFKAPRHVVFTELPKTSTGKIQKYVLRQQAAEL